MNTNTLRGNGRNKPLNLEIDSMLVLSGLFEAKETNREIVAVFQNRFKVESENIVSMDLCGFNSVSEVVDAIQLEINKLPGRILLAGHSAGAQLLTKHFACNPKVKLVVNINGPPHNPCSYPVWLWTSTLKYFSKLISGKSFMIDTETSRKLFGKALPDSLSVPCAPRIILSMNLGCLWGNSGPKKEERSKRHSRVLYVATKGDKLIKPSVVEKMAKKYGGSFLLLDWPDHFPQIGARATRNIRETLFAIEDM